MHRKIKFSSQDFLRGKVQLVIHPDEIEAALEADSQRNCKGVKQQDCKEKETVEIPCRFHPDMLRQRGRPAPEKATAPTVVIKSPESLVRRVSKHQAEWALIEKGITNLTKKETFVPKKQIHPSGFLV